MRAIGAVLAIAILVAATAFFTSAPSRVEIVWQDWQIDTSVGVLVAAAVLAALVVAAVLRLLLLLLGSPRAFARGRRERRRRAGYQALTRGMVAVAAGDAQEARRHARKAEALLAEPPLTLLLSAQAAQIGGDETAAKRFFTLMLDRPEIELLGLRGLFNQALRAGDRGTALSLAERAATLRPDAGWAVQSLFDLETREGRWPAAREALAKIAKIGILAPEIARRHRGVIDYELSRQAIAEGDRRRGLALAAQAQSLTPDLAMPAAYHARLLLQQGDAGRAAKAVERAWRSAPHPDLARLYGEISAAENPLARIVRFERLAAQNPAARESQMVLAEAASAAQLWGEARRHLEQALRADPVPMAPLNGFQTHMDHRAETEDGAFARATPRLCRMMARLEEAEHADNAAAHQWLERAEHALPDPCYLCANCGADSLDWNSLCPRCGAFDALAWRTPVWAGLPLPVESRLGTEPIAVRAVEPLSTNVGSG